MYPVLQGQRQRSVPRTPVADIAGEGSAWRSTGGVHAPSGAGPGSRVATHARGRVRRRLTTNHGGRLVRSITERWLSRPPLVACRPARGVACCCCRQVVEDFASRASASYPQRATRQLKLNNAPRSPREGLGVCAAGPSAPGKWREPSAEWVRTFALLTPPPAPPTLYVRSGALRPPRKRRMRMRRAESSSPSSSPSAPIEHFPASTRAVAPRVGAQSPRRGLRPLGAPHRRNEGRRARRREGVESVPD
eukprot:scaffold751_cov395-Prasinococcus_capsulatus_cf.AAC.36